MSSAAATKRPRSPLLIVGIVLVAVAVLAAGGFAAWKLLSTGSSENEVAMMNSAFGNGTAASAGGYDFYWDPEAEGLMRAKADGSEAPQKIAEQAEEYGYLYVLCASDQYVYYITAPYASDYPIALRCVSLDGSDRKTVYEPGQALDDTQAYISSACVLDDQLYVLVDMGYANSNAETATYYVLRMGLDGSDVQTIAQINDMSYGGIAMAPDAVYYSSEGDVYVQAYDAPQPTRIYRSGCDTTSRPVLYCDRLYVWCSGSSGGYLASMNPDGSDAKELYRVSSDTWINDKLVTIVDGKAYFTDNGPENSAAISEAMTLYTVSLKEGATPEQIGTLEPINANPYVVNAGDHLLVIMGAMDTKGAAYGAYNLKYDGSISTVYKVYPY